METTNEAEPKRCPFCGRKPYLYKSENFFFIHCGFCDISTKVYRTLDEILDFWNHRGRRKVKNDV